MSKTFRAWDVDQPLLLAPSVQELVPAGHLAHLVRDTVRESLDLSAIVGQYREERGYPPYHPVMMVALLLYAYCRGITSSRQIARACEERVDFMALTAHQAPDFRTISDFRKRHREALGGLFGQVVGLCAEAGLVKLGHVALDGTKVKQHELQAIGEGHNTPSPLDGLLRRMALLTHRSCPLQLVQIQPNTGTEAGLVSGGTATCPAGRCSKPRR